MLSFGTLQFSDPHALALDALPATAGLFAILVPNYEYRPDPYEPIYFGESANLRVAVGTHHTAYNRWRWHPRGRGCGRAGRSPRGTTARRNHGRPAGPASAPGSRAPSRCRPRW